LRYATGRGNAIPSKPERGALFTPRSHFKTSPRLLAYALCLALPATATQKHLKHVAGCVLAHWSMHGQPRTQSTGDTIQPVRALSDPHLCPRPRTHRK
ncbi:hypothetical protein IAQ61_010108, partial [Plenodomus lingam]|uniref:uncharacterized protein n=1 Tax=Leptosphaeria maculans TaxID=5022 RepID=UPI0033277A3D